MYKKKNRKEQRKKQKILAAVVCIIAAACIAGIALYIHAGADHAAVSGDEAGGASADSDVITYNGKKYVPNDHLSNYLFIGVDSDTSLNDDSTSAPGSGGQADAVYLVSFDRKEKTVRTFAVPRDTMTQIETFSPDGKSLGYSENHLSLQYAYGDGKQKSCELMESAVSKLFMDMDISGYTSVNLKSIPQLTSLVDYVDVVVPDDSLESADPAFKKGASVRLTPENTETFVRSRDTGTSQSAITRMNRQKVYIRAFAERVQDLQSQDSSTVTRIYEGLQDYMITDMSNDLFVKLAGARREGDIVTIPGEGTSGDLYDEYKVDQDGLYDLIIRNFYREAQ